MGVASAQNVTIINKYGEISDTTSKEGFVLKSVSEHTYIINEYEPANTGIRSNLQQMIRYGLRSYIDSQIQAYDGQVLISEDLDDFNLAVNSIISNAVWIHDLPFAQEFDGFSDATMRQLLAIFNLDGNFLDDSKSSLQTSKNGEISLYTFQRMVFDLKVRMEREVNDFLNLHLPYPGQQLNDDGDSHILAEKNYNLKSWDHNTEDLLDVEPDFQIEDQRNKKDVKPNDQLELSQRIVELLESNNEILSRHDQRFDDMQRQINEIKVEKSTQENTYVEAELAELRELIMDLSTSEKRPSSSSLISKSAPIIVIFEKNEHTLSLANQAVLNSAVNQLRSDSSLHGMITGFADKTGDPAFNAWISKQRAEAVKSYLISRNIASQRLEVNFLGDTASEFANPADRKVQVDFVPNEITKY